MNGFQFWSAAHLVPLAAAFLVFAGLIILRRPLRNPPVNKAARLTIAAVLLGCELSLQLSYVLTNTWSIYSLPFQLCSLTLLLAAAALALGAKSGRLAVIVFYLGTLGALQALLTPNLDYGFPHFRYFHFFIAHIGIIAAALMITAVDGYRPKPRSIAEAMLWLHVLAIPAAVANSWTGETNFMFLARKPETASLLDLLSPWPWYLLQLEAIALLLCSLLYLIAAAAATLFNKRRNFE